MAETQSVPPVAPVSGNAFILQELHLYNWGAFGGRHQATIDVDNTAIIGPTGSGKTTLVDALMTLLCANPKYNLASTGGHESDRDLVSYVRGVSGSGTDGSTSDHIARQGRTVTGVAARLLRRDGEQVLLGGVFWLDGSSSSVSDLQRRWFFSQASGQTLDLWLEEHHAGGARALGRLEKSVDGLRLFTSKSAYLARLRSFFEVGENAFTLLNRAAGLKQLNSIDDIFRELVLDDHAAFDDALRVAGDFDELTAIHAEVALARSQFLSLLPLRDMAGKHQRLQAQLTHWQQLQQAAPLWFAQQGLRLWQQREDGLRTQCEAQAQSCAALRTELDAAKSQAQIRLEAYLQAGGAGIEDLRHGIATQQAELRRLTQNVQDYFATLRSLSLDTPASVTAQGLSGHQQLAGPALARLADSRQQLAEAADSAVAHEHNARESLRQLQQEREAVRERPGSNLPAAFQRFRAELAAQLRLPEEDLPFVAELIEVRKEAQHWRGAIERAIGGQRLRILVPSRMMRGALQWVNQRHNHLHVRLLEVRDTQAEVSFWEDGFCRKLNFRQHASLAALKALLGGLDRHCVDNPQDLQQTPHAMTQQGLMSGKGQQYDKQDQKRLEADWMTGFDNRDRLALLDGQIAQAQQDWQQRGQEKQQAQRECDAASQRQHLWQRLQALRIEDLDVATAQAVLARQEGRLAALLDPASDTARARTQWEAAQAACEQCADVLQEQTQALVRLEVVLSEARKQTAVYAQRLGAEPDAGLLAQAQEALASFLAPDCEALPESERRANQHVQQQRERHQTQLAEMHKDVIRQMGRAHKEDRGALADAPQEVEALPQYLERLRVLEEEALPEKRLRFQAYLNESSEQGVNRLLTDIDTQVIDIQERIAALNQTLMRVDFQPGRYLQLDPRPVVHQSLQNLNKALGMLRSERLRDDDGESHYRALSHMVDLLREAAANRRTKAAQALLDARYRLQFAVLVMDRDTGVVLERRTGSQGGSGGEKEIIASYVLTASLSYALCPPGRSRPVFGTIVLDEAFSKSSQAVAGRIIQALREFGLHALFVTPNKELRLLRNHTRSAVVVHRRGQQAVLASLRWEELDAHARQRRATA